MTLSELLQYHASEGGLLCASSAFDIARDADFDTSGIDFAQWVKTANAFAIADTLRGNVLGARLFQTADGYAFAEMACGTITNGDMAWPSESAFAASMHDKGIAYNVVRIV